MTVRPPTLLLTVVISATMLVGCFKTPTDPESNESPARPGRLVVSSSTDTLNAIGDQLQLSVRRQDLDGNTMPGTAVTWRSLNPEVATVNEVGRVVSRGVGAALIVVACADCSDVPDTASVFVRQVAASASLLPEAATLAQGFNGQLRAVAVDSNDVKIENAVFTWSSSEPSVASVTDGRVDALSLGTTMIDASVGGEQATSWITVVSTNPPVASVTVSPSDTTIATGETTQLDATAEDASGVAILGLTFDWATSDSSVAQVSQGLVEGLSPGYVTVTASYGGRTGSASLTVTPPPPPPSSVIPAFPGAEGYGATTLSSCDRSNLRVFPVTNLDDSGSGSFRQALADVEAAPDGHLKVMVFRVAGYIDLSSKIQFRGNCLYIAGQTSPGDGVTIRGRGIEFRFDVYDIVIRYLRFRLGADPSEITPILVRNGSNYLLDHNSFSWATGIMVRFTSTYVTGSGPINQITVQRSLFGESFATHPTGLHFGGMPKVDSAGVEAGWRRLTHYSAHHNLFASVHHRNPNLKAPYGEAINNVVHNWSLDAGQTGREVIADFANNYFQKGPMSKGSYYPIGIDMTNILDDPFYTPSIYAKGNLSFGGGQHSDQNTDPSADNWTGPGRVVGWYLQDPDNDPIPEYQRDRRIDGLTYAAQYPVTIETALSAFNSVLGDVGANKRLDCEGNWVPMADPIDLRLIGEVEAGTGVSSTPSDENALGGYPALQSGTPCQDSDGDGMPDAWELANSLDPNNPADASWIGAMGYTYMEHFMNGSKPR